MIRLDLGNNSELPQTLEIVRCNHLSVHQSKSSIALSILLVELFKIIEQHMIGFIANRMNRYLHPGSIRSKHVTEKLAFYELTIVIHHQRTPASAIVWIVRVRLKEPRGTC